MGRLLRCVAVAVTILLPAATLSSAVWTGDDAGLFRPLGGVDAAISGLPSTPPAGWNSWNTFGCAVDEWRLRAQADSMVATGMRDAGYRYVVVDDCWFDPTRAADGRLRADPTRFPSGMRALGDYLHARGLGFGIYAGAGKLTCAQLAATYPGATGSGGHERLDAATFAEWGVDYVKYDWCSTDSDLDRQIHAFTEMRDALRMTGRPIVYSINPNSGVGASPGARYDWAGIATMARTTQDVLPAWRLPADPALGLSIGVDQAVTATGPLGPRHRPGYWNDPDMLVVGVPGVAGSATPGLTPAEARTQFGMWAMLSAPLMAGNDLTAMSPEVRRILTDPTVLAVDRSPGAPAVSVRPGVWRKRLGAGAVVVALHNVADTAMRISVGLGEVNLAAGRCRARDLWTGVESTAVDTLTRTVAAHDTVLVRLTVG